MKYKELKSLYEEYFSIATLGKDFNDRLGLISLICYLYNKLKPKNPDLTYWYLLYKMGSKEVPDKYLIGLSIICENFSENCSEFPNFGIKDKDIPKRIKELLHNWLPF